MVDFCGNWNWSCGHYVVNGKLSGDQSSTDESGEKSAIGVRVFFILKTLLGNGSKMAKHGEAWRGMERRWSTDE